MFRNYIKIAVRSLMRHKAYSIINVLGLAISIAACLILYMIITYETGYDTFQPNYKNIVQVGTESRSANEVNFTSGVPFPLVDVLRTNFPSVPVGAVYSSYGSQITVLNNGKSDKKFIEGYGAFFMEPGFFKVFNYTFLAGSAAVLAEPNTVILSKGMAAKYFGDWKNAMGKNIKMDNALTLRVSAIIDEPTLHSDFPLYVIGSYITMKNNPNLYNYVPEWGSITSNHQVFMLLPNGANRADMEKRINAAVDKFYQNSLLNKRVHFFEPLSAIHFDKRLSNFGDHTTSRSKLITLGLIGFLIIIMAAINFVNLSTAKAVTRSKEIGVRKVLGGSRKQLFWQMMGETGMVVLTATVLALIITIIAIPYISHIISIQETLSIFRLDILLFTLAGILTVTFLSGIYPSLILSGFTPALALKNKITSATVGGISLRRSLVITQFAISQMLIIGTIVAVTQMNYVSKADLGFNKEGIMVISSNSDSALVSRQASFKQKLLQMPGVQSVSFSSDVPSSDNNWSANFAYDHRPDEQFGIFFKFADPDYFKTFGLKIIAGRPYSLTDTINEVVVNQTLLKMLNVKNPQDAIGKPIHVGGKKQVWKTIVGVVQDFKTNSLREGVKPIYMSCRSKYYGTTSIKLNTNNLSHIQTGIQVLWDKYFPEYATTSSFMADNVDSFYRQENQLSLVYKIFAGLAIFISCLGLYGLVSFMAVQRTKEVGIRKVLGASVTNIIYLFSKEFTLLICIAFVIAAPTAFYLMHDWLSNFVFRIDIGVGVFLIAIISSVIIAWLTVGFQAVKAALANPVKSLRNE